MATTVTRLNWTIKRGTQLSASGTWRDPSGAVTAPAQPSPHENRSPQPQPEQPEATDVPLS
jgi:hypothetical protein